MKYPSAGWIERSDTWGCDYADWFSVCVPIVTYSPLLSLLFFFSSYISQDIFPLSKLNIVSLKGFMVSLRAISVLYLRFVLRWRLVLFQLFVFV